MEKTLYLMPQGFGALQIKNAFVEGAGNSFGCKEARTRALEMTDVKKGLGGSRLKIHRLFGRPFVGAFQRIAVFVEKSGENTALELVDSAKEEKTAVKIATKRAKVFMVSGILLKQRNEYTQGPPI